MKSSRAPAETPASPSSDDLIQQWEVGDDSHSSSSDEDNKNTYVLGYERDDENLTSASVIDTNSVIDSDTEFADSGSSSAPQNSNPESQTVDDSTLLPSVAALLAMNLGIVSLRYELNERGVSFESDSDYSTLMSSFAVTS